MLGWLRWQPQTLKSEGMALYLKRGARPKENILNLSADAPTHTTSYLSTSTSATFIWPCRSITAFKWECRPTRASSCAICITATNIRAVGVVEWLSYELSHEEVGGTKT